MSSFSRLKFQCNTNQAVLGAAAFFTLFVNLAFFRNLITTFAASPGGRGHIVSLALVLFCTLIMFLSVLSFRLIFKPALAFLFLLSAVTAYFMDTYNVIIDHDMIVNLISTDAAESGDLFTTRLFLYLLLGLLPSFVLSRIVIRPESAGRALRSRMKLTTGAMLAALSLILISSAFYASFVREHKVLRYYANPLTPIHAAYKFARMQLTSAETRLGAIGEDAHIPVADIDRELVIMVVGETARADRFSLNGYTLETNPQLATKDVISFTQASACGTSTAISVPCMFSIYDHDQYSGNKAASTQNLLDVLGHAGVSMLWRDNNSNSKGVADRIPTEDFRSPELNPLCDEECRDEGMLAGLQEFIDRQEGGDILVILHQMGSHGPAYYKRYPLKFHVFEPTCDTSQLDACSQAEISNSYDNTIRYTDHFLATVIEFLRSNDHRFETAMLYASDHGESLGESGLYLHGLPYWIAPDAQTRVPMILWFGKNYDGVDVDALRQLSNEPISHDNIFHTMLGLFEINTGVYDGTKDLLQQSRVLASTPREYN